MTRPDPPPGPRLRLVLEAGVAIGPGKADLLEAVDATGSITAAGRSLGMSYRRAWTLLDSLNKAFDQPVVAARIGGKGGGRAQLTAFGRELLDRYRRMEARTEAAVAADLAALRRRLNPAD
jgi:molybdate transport system regulatory protein